MTPQDRAAYAVELARYAAVLAEASHAVGLRRDAAAYLQAESERIAREAAIHSSMAQDAMAAEAACPPWAHRTDR